jgi:hypothetical protein
MDRPYISNDHWQASNSGHVRYAESGSKFGALAATPQAMAG